MDTVEQSGRAGGRVVKRVLLIEDGGSVAELVAPILHESGSVEDRVSSVAGALISD